ncbi:MAG: PspC domain-containing protein [Propionibacteriaceae bacterium]|nr:PspC domain-containing protein [Propionibacteriaceae bacterium]
MKSTRPFRRSSTDTIVGGLCGGLAEALGLNPGIVRAGFVLLTLVTNGSALIVYLVCCLVIPRAQATVRRPRPAARPQPRPARHRPRAVLAAVVITTLLVGLIARTFDGGVSGPAIGGLLLLGLLVPLAVLIAVGLRRVHRAAPTRPSELAQAWTRWQDRLREVEGQAQPPAPGVALPSCLAEAAQFGPATTGFQPPVPSPLDLPRDPAWVPAAPAPARAATPAPTPVTRFAEPGRPDQVPLVVDQFLPTVAPDAAVEPAVTAVAVRRKHPVAVGWATLVSLAAVLGALWLDRDGLGRDPVAVVGGVSGVLGLALVASPWAGRPRWLAPVTGLLVAGTACALLLLTLFR